MSGIRSFRVDKGSHTNAPLRGKNTQAKLGSEATGSLRVFVPVSSASAFSVLLVALAENISICHI